MGFWSFDPPPELIGPARLVARRYAGSLKEGAEVIAVVLSVNPRSTSTGSVGVIEARCQVHCRHTSTRGWRGPHLWLCSPAQADGAGVVERVGNK